MQEIDQPSAGTEKSNRITHDVLDKEISSFRRSLTGVGIEFVFGAGMFISSYYDRNATHALISIAATLAGSAYSLIDGRIVKSFFKNEPNDTVQNDLNYQANRLVYRGEGLRIGDKEIQNGENFYYVKLAELVKRKAGKSMQDIGSAIDYYGHCLADLSNKIVDTDYSFVAIDVESGSGILSGISNPGLKKSTKAEVYTGKDAEVEGNNQLLLIAKEYFTDFDISQRQNFLKVVDAINDPVINQLLTTADTTGEFANFDMLKSLLLERIKLILGQEIYVNFNAAPEVSLAKTGELGIPMKQKGYRSSYVRENNDEYEHVGVDYQNGSKSVQSVDKLLQIGNKGINRILESESSLKRAQLIFTLGKIIKTSDFERLVSSDKVSTDEILELINSVYHIYPRGYYPWTEYKTNLRPLYKSILLSSLAFLALRTTPDFIADFNAADFGVANGRETEKLKGVPPYVPEWRVSGSLPAEGYYVTGTSHEFVKDEWVINDEAAREVVIPPLLGPDDKEYLLLERTEIVDVFNPSFKIPIKNDTKLKALKIEGPDGLLPFQTYELTDGTVNIKLSGNAFTLPPWVYIEAYLVPAEQWDVRAVDKLRGLNSELFSDELDEIMAEIKLKNSSTGFNYAAFETVRDDHNYSVDPKYAKKLDNISQAEEMANAVADLPACDCSQCNSEAVILANSIPGPGVVNLATGYVAISEHNSGSFEGQLRSDTKHAFGIDSEGLTFDATPVNVANDPATQAYMKQLNTSIDLTIEWDNMRREITEKASESRRRNMEFIGALSLVSAFLATHETMKRMKGDINFVDTEAVNNRIILRLFSRQDLKLAYNFFNWLSWSDIEIKNDKVVKETAMPIPSLELDEETTKTELYKLIQGSIDKSRISFLIDNPREVDRLARQVGFEGSGFTYVKLQLLAERILAKKSSTNNIKRGVDK